MPDDCSIQPLRVAEIPAIGALARAIWREHHVKEIRDGVFYPTRFASPQGTLIPLTPHESLIVYRPKPTVRLGQRSVPVQQLWLFELVQTA